jgi:hypothetical protein
MQQGTATDAAMVDDELLGGLDGAGDVAMGGGGSSSVAAAVARAMEEEEEESGAGACVPPLALHLAYLIHILLSISSLRLPFALDPRFASVAAATAAAVAPGTTGRTSSKQFLQALAGASRAAGPHLAGLFRSGGGVLEGGAGGSTGGGINVDTAHAGSAPVGRTPPNLPQPLRISMAQLDAQPVMYQASCYSGVYVSG